MSTHIGGLYRFLLPNSPRDFRMLFIIGLMLSMCLLSNAQPDIISIPNLDTVASTVILPPPPFDPILDTVQTTIPIVLPPVDVLTEITPTSPPPGTSSGDARDADLIVIPNLFTPNGDGYNDTWMIEGLRSRGKYDIQIYSRQGSLLFESHDYSNDWDGRYNGTPLPSGTYYYIFRIKKAGFLQRGMLTILRP